MSELLQRPRFLRPRDDDELVVYNRHHHLPLQEQRQLLPIWRQRSSLLYLLQQHQVLLVQGETGSGKSTQIPQYVCEAGYCTGAQQVVVCVPRGAAALTLAARTAEETNTVLGEKVGYSVGFDNKYSSNTQIKFVSEGVLLRELLADPLLTQYSCVMLDEVHERNQLTDVLMGLLKKILKKRKNLKLVVSSATMDAEFLRDYFELNKKKRKLGEKPARPTAAILTVEGRMFPVDIFYTKEPVPDYVQATVDTVIKIHETEPAGDMLAFLTGQEEVLRVVQLLSQYTPSRERSLRLLVLALYGGLPRAQQLQAYSRAPANTRRVIVSTNLAETSLTIPHITYVVDCGFCKVLYWDPVSRLEGLLLCPVSQQAARQRAGRAGRLQPGKCYRLYTEEAHSSLSVSVLPELQRADLTQTILTLKAMGIDNILRFPFPSAPSAAAVLSALQSLLALRAIDQAGRLTGLLDPQEEGEGDGLGARMAELPLPPALAHMLLNSDKFGCYEEVLWLVSALQVDSVYLRPEGAQQALQARIQKRNNFEVCEGDLLTLLNVCVSYSQHSVQVRTQAQLSQWCRTRGLLKPALEKVCSIRDSLHRLVKGKNIPMQKPTASVESVCRCVCASLFMSAACLRPSGTYEQLSCSSTSRQLHISPDSCLYHTRQPQWVVFVSVSAGAGGNTYMRNITVINRDWLQELAPHYYREH